MKDKGKTKEQLLRELQELRQRISELEASKTKYKRVDEWLQDNQEVLSKFMDSVPDAFVLFDSEMNYIIFNKAAQELTGVTLEQAIGKNVCDFVPDIKTSGRYDRYMEVIRTGKPFFAEELVPGTIFGDRYFSIRAFKASEVAEAVGVIFTDITERKKAEEALTKSEATYRELVDSIDDAFFALDKNLRYTYWNKASEKLTGISAKDAMGKSLYQIFPDTPETKEAEEMYRDVLETGQRQSIITEFHLGGKGYLFEISAYPAGDGISVFAKDITEHQKKAEEALRESTEKFRLAFENANTGMYLVEIDGHITKVNKMMCAIFGYSPEELESMTVNDITHPDDLDISLEFIKRCLSGEIISGSFEKRYIHKQGHVVCELISSSLIRDSNGSPLHFISQIQDITHRKQMEEALRESEEKYRALAENSFTGIFILQDNKFVYANNRFAEMHGYKTKEILGMEYWKLVHPDEMEITRERIAKILEGKTVSQPFEKRRLKKDGTTFYAEIMSAATEYRGKPAIMGNVLDITHRKQAENELLYREAFIRNIAAISAEFINLPAGEIDNGIDHALKTIGEFCSVDRSYVFLFSSDGMTQNCSNEWCAEGIEPFIQRLKGLPTDNYKTTKIIKSNDVFHIPDVSKLPPEYSFEKEHFQMQGIQSIINVPIVTKGNIIGLIGFDAVKAKQTWSEDIITLLRIVGELFAHALERKRTEGELGLRAQLLDNATDSIILHDTEGNIIYVNEVAYRSHGYSREEFMRMKYHQMVAPDYAGVFQRGRQKLLQNGHVKLESAHLRKDKSIMPVEVNASMIELDNKKLILGIIRDITERKRLEAERREMELKAQVASRLASVGEMAAGIAHEINNPLTGVIGYAELLQTQEDVPAHIKKDLETIHQGAQRVADIVKRLLTFARQSKPMRDYVIINELVQNTLELRAYQLRSNNITVTTRLDPELSLTVADSGQLQQVFLNILVNAETEMKLAHGKGKLLIKTEKVDNNIRISFKDDGPGIDRKNLERIFDPFFTTREVGQGTGLGLSLCHGIVTEHGGRIWAESEKGKGATFFVELPIITRIEQLKMAEPDSEETGAVNQARILVVDDEEVVRTFLSRVLTEEGHQVDAVDNAEDALEKIKTERYHLIMLDIKMPGMNGMELYQRIKKIARSLIQRVVFVTGDVLGADTEAFLAKTKSPYITKPFDARQLKKELKRLLS